MKTGKSVGVDFGINSFAIDSEGNRFENPKRFAKMIDKIRYYNQILSRKKIGSSNWNRTKLKLNKIYEKLHNQRIDFLHKVSRFYVNNFDTICIEDLQIKPLLLKKNSMRKKRYRTLHRNISDTSWGIFFRYLSYKAENADKKIIKVNPKNTSQRCSSCNILVKKTLSIRKHICPNCGFKADRDYNAALNIYNAGLRRPFKLTEELKSLRMISFNDINTGKILPMKQETSLQNRSSS